MKSFQQFISESVNIAGDFNGNLYMNSSQPETATESFLADVVWQGKLYRMQLERDGLTKTPYELSLICTSDTANASVFASLDWEEVSR